MKRFIPFVDGPPRVAVIRLAGAIGTGRTPLNDATLAPLIERAFRRGKPKAVALLINSPGGSPVQSSRIASRIRRLADEKKLPVHAFVEDVAASGGYWLACAADDIYADRASIVGSIGVISGGFGAQDFIAKHGIERRIYTAGQSKSQLDPFKDENPEDVARLQVILDKMHQVFIDHVQQGRGARLADDPRLFTGEFWLAEDAKDLGLIDGIGHIEAVMKEKYGEDVKFIRYDKKRGMLSRFGLSIADEALATLEERALLARYGL
ncbi:S49 family peptidase [Rhodalgimonas zhirmunskyi]|uniref:S49 family peptidase n=1 Tax=Rhodalgimonas zhirmunskyi TaxID=2964767 RepID=A0AAJ1UET7_9RHOB|nr:S49 family peptidase [Rhodoalgimonas zhirmunskyi]MDQ2094737.1 S49 family peptidase [Rhodoalgimonas zhirmunskyi]